LLCDELQGKHSQQISPSYVRVVLILLTMGGRPITYFPSGGGALISEGGRS
jgi:hypothetical protein